MGKVGETQAKKLTVRQEQAALHVALDQLSDREIAAQAGITEEGLRKWKKRPEFAGRVVELRAAFARAVEGLCIADRQARVRTLQDLVDRMTRVVEGRAEDLAEAPGGSSGLLVRQYKQVGKDDYREEYPFDAALVREMRATLQQAAQELGQWTTKSELKVSDLDAAIERELRRLNENLPSPSSEGASQIVSGNKSDDL